jgi:hypothetical protein
MFRQDDLLLGPTFSNKGNWTSWPPHEHRDTLEEVYVYFNMPAPAFGIQLAYNDLAYPDVMFPVRENDAMVVHHGYPSERCHPGTFHQFRLDPLCEKGSDRPKMGCGQCSTRIQTIEHMKTKLVRSDHLQSFIVFDDD